MTNLIKALALGLALISSSLLPAGAIAGDTLQRVIDFKTLRIGMSGDQPPFNVVNREGVPMGFDVDLGVALAGAMKVKPELKRYPFGELLEALENDEVDIVISGMAITPQRAEYVSFVGPYMMSGKSILTKNSVLAKVSEADQFNRKDLKLAALKNSTSSDFVTTAAPEATLVELNTYEEGIKMINEGTVDGMVADMPVCVLTVLRYPDAGFVTLDKPLTIEPVGIAVKSGDPEFRNLVDNYLDAYGKVGILAKIRKKWFENNSWVAALP
ncbi:MAG: transporter substrate-binding domain-containing protein [Halieaceae bacterium]|nr:transporter substrate-binding domain-containing protein [Halieaceae bacterium]